jgi:hypothetical protein
LYDLFSTSPIDSTPVGEFMNGVGKKKQTAIHDKVQAKAAKGANVEV